MVRLQVMVFMFGKIKINLKANGLKTYVMEMVVTFSTMETSMSGSMLMGNLMGLDNINGQMDPHTQEISKMVWKMVKGNGEENHWLQYKEQNAINMKVSTKWIKSTELVFLNGKVAIHMLVITKMMSEVAMGSWGGQMVVSTWVCGKEGYRVESALWFFLINRLEQVSSSKMSI